MLASRLHVTPCHCPTLTSLGAIVAKRLPKMIRDQRIVPSGLELADGFGSQLLMPSHGITMAMGLGGG